MMEAYTHLTGPGVAAAVLIIAKYLYQSAFVAGPRDKYTPLSN